MNVKRVRREWRARRRAHVLTGLVRERLPADFVVTGDDDAWPMVGTALLSRMTTTMQMLFALQRHQRSADANTLLRSLYEYLVYFAWLAADPGPARLEAWRRSDLRIRVAAVSEAAGRGVELMSTADLRALKAQVASMQGDRLTLEALAEQADAHWVGKLPGMDTAGSISTFRGLYTVLYRQHSGTAHPSYRSLHPVVVDINQAHKQVVLEGRYEGRGPFGMATVIYSFALYVAAASLGWPIADRVSSAFGRHAAI